MFETAVCDEKLSLRTAKRALLPAVKHDAVNVKIWG